MQQEFKLWTLNFLFVHYTTLLYYSLPCDTLLSCIFRNEEMQQGSFYLKSPPVHFITSLIQLHIHSSINKDSDADIQEPHGYTENHKQGFMQTPQLKGVLD